MQTAVQRHATPVFAGSKPVQTDSSLGARLQAYRAGWQDLIAWDQKVHPLEPVLEQVKVDRLVRSAQDFIQRQNAASKSEAVPFIVGISGSPASGKTTVKNHWLSAFQAQANPLVGWRKKQHGPVVQEIELDHYYRDLSKERAQLGDDAFFKSTNLDEPGVVSLNKARKDLFMLKNGKAIRLPHYSFPDSSRKLGQKLTSPSPFVLVEGLFAFVPKPLRELMDLKIFFSVDDQTIHDRWWKRAPERKLDNEAGVVMFNRAMEGYRAHTEPTRDHADVVVNAAAPLKAVNDTMTQVTKLLLKTFYPVEH